jgi:hypothetical protein
MDISLSSSIEPSPDYLLEVLEAFAECARVANHQTLSHKALTEPSEAATALRSLAEAATRLPQLAYQIGKLLEGFAGAPVPAQAALSEAAELAEQLAAAFRAAAREAAQVHPGAGSAP